MKVLQCKTEFEWHRRRAKLIRVYMRLPGQVAIQDSTHGKLVVRVKNTELTLLRPAMRSCIPSMQK